MINIKPPKVGVPFFFICLSPIVVLTFWPAFIFLNNGININPATIDSIKPSIIAIAAFAKTSIYTPLPKENYTTIFIRKSLINNWFTLHIQYKYYV